MQITPSIIVNLFCFVGLFLAVFSLAIMARQRKALTGQRRPPQQSRSEPAQPRGQAYALIPMLLTDAEQSFLAALRLAAPLELLICPQVRLANLVRPTARSARQHKYDFYRIQAKCVDFVLCEPATTVPRLVIELDDASHQRAARQKRDDFVDTVLGQVGLPILHITGQRRYDTQQLAEAIRLKVHGVATLPVPLHTPKPVLANGWSTPSKPAVQSIEAQAVFVPALREATYICWQCQREVRRDAQC